MTSLPTALRWTRWSGLTALLGGPFALVLTGPFAAAYFYAYPGFETPPGWVPALRALLDPLLAFAGPQEVYATYGRLFALVYALLLPGLAGLHALHAGTGARLERLGYGVIGAGLLTTLVGVLGDSWADGLGFMLETIGLLLLVSAVAYGAALLRARVVPRWSAWLPAGQAAIPAMIVVKHIPSAPTRCFALAWIGLGSVPWSGKRHHLPAAGRQAPA